MSRILSAAMLATLLIGYAAARARAGEASAEWAGGIGADAPAYCTSYTTGSDTHTACAPSGPAVQGSAIVCRSYTVGSDTHAECAPVPAPRLSSPREKTALPVPPPAFTLRCYTYHIGSSAYTDCR